MDLHALVSVFVCIRCMFGCVCLFLCEVHACVHACVRVGVGLLLYFNTHFVVVLLSLHCVTGVGWFYNAKSIHVAYVSF